MNKLAEKIQLEKNYDLIESYIHKAIVNNEGMEKAKQKTDKKNRQIITTTQQMVKNNVQKTFENEFILLSILERLGSMTEEAVGVMTYQKKMKDLYQKAKKELGI